MTKRSKNLGLVMPTAAEDAAIAAGVAQDTDTMEITAADMARMQPLRRPGRPKVEQPKVPVTMRVDADVLEAIKASGTGWQTRVNAVLREAVRRGKLAEIPSGQSTLTAIEALPRGVLPVQPIPRAVVQQQARKDLLAIAASLRQAAVAEGLDITEIDRVIKVAAVRQSGDRSTAKAGARKPQNIAKLVEKCK